MAQSTNAHIAAFAIQKQRLKYVPARFQSSPVHQLKYTSVVIKYTCTVCLKKMALLCNGIARNGMDRF